MQITVLTRYNHIDTPDLYGVTRQYTQVFETHGADGATYQSDSRIAVIKAKVNADGLNPNKRRYWVSVPAEATKTIDHRTGQVLTVEKCQLIGLDHDDD